MSLRWEEGYTSTSNILKTLATKITNNQADINWILHYPSDIEDIENTFTLKYELKDASTVLNTVYIEFHKPNKISIKDRATNTIVNNKDNYSCIYITFGENYTNPSTTTDKGTWGNNCSSVMSRFSWFMGDTSATLQNWTPIQYWLSITDSNISIVFEGSSIASKTDRLISWAYLGQIKSFDIDTAKTDIKDNFAVTVSSDMLPYEYLLPADISKYGIGTATNVLDVGVLRTISGFPMQGYYVHQLSGDEFKFNSPTSRSQWTGKYHMTPIYLYHEFDGYRGTLFNSIMGSAGSLVNLDELIYKYTDDSNNNVEEVYKVFIINAPYSLLNNSANINYCIAILKSKSN